MICTHGTVVGLGEAFPGIHAYLPSLESHFRSGGCQPGVKVDHPPGNRTRAQTNRLGEGTLADQPVYG